MEAAEILGFIVSTLSVIAFLGTFFYWVFGRFTKMWELRFSILENDIHSLAEDSKNQRTRTDQLFEILINVMKDKKI